MTLGFDEGRAARARYQIPAGYKDPNQCIGCLKTDNMIGMADLGRDIDWYGVPYLCKDCAIEVAQLFGAIPETVYQGLVTDLTEMHRINEELRTENSALRGIVDGYERLGIASIGSLAVSPRDSIPPPEHPGGISEESGTTEPSEINDPSTDGGEDDGSGVSETDDREQSGGDSEADEPSSVEEPGDILSDSDSELSRFLRGE